MGDAHSVGAPYLGASTSVRSGENQSMRGRMALPVPVSEAVGEQMLRLVAEQARAAAGCAAAGVTIVNDRGGALILGSSLLGARLEQVQWDAGHGPGLEAIRQLQVFNVACLATTTSWPGFVSGALTMGMRSSLAVPITLRGRALGALDLYACDPAAFDGAEELTLHFAGEAAVALSHPDIAVVGPAARPATQRPATQHTAAEGAGPVRRPVAPGA